MASPVEPIWTKIRDAIAAQLRSNIKSSQNSLYWNEFVTVLTEPRPDRPETSDLPVIVVQHWGALSAREYVGDGRQVTGQFGIRLDCVIANDPADDVDPFTEMNRFCQDIHRALTTTRNLGVDGVRRISFPQDALYDEGALAREQGFTLFTYFAVVDYSFEDTAP